jgi:four helix bundle protein
MKTHKDLEVWKKSISIVTDIYSLTKKFPKEEIYCITSQIRRSAISIPSNIAEGCSRRGVKEYINFLYISLGSATELDTHLIISQNLYFAHRDELLIIQSKLDEIRRMIIGLIKSLKVEKTNP